MLACGIWFWQRAFGVLGFLVMEAKRYSARVTASTLPALHDNERFLVLF
jgi:hypothetical protein